MSCILSHRLRLYDGRNTKYALYSASRTLARSADRVFVATDGAINRAAAPFITLWVSDGYAPAGAAYVPAEAAPRNWLRRLAETCPALKIVFGRANPCLA